MAWGAHACSTPWLISAKRLAAASFSSSVPFTLSWIVATKGHLHKTTQSDVTFCSSVKVVLTG